MVNIELNCSNNFSFWFISSDIVTFKIYCPNNLSVSVVLFLCLSLHEKDLSSLPWYSKKCPSYELKHSEQI